MIIVTFTITVNRDQRDEVLIELEKLVKASRKAAGCLSYSFYADAWAPNLLRTYQEWESRATLKAHTQTPHMAAWREARDKFMAAGDLDQDTPTLYETTPISRADL